MTNGEAKFILVAYRPNGSDAEDPRLAEALALARRDPELGAWFTSQLAFDGRVSAQLRELQPPAGLREMILAGARASRRVYPRRRLLLWLGFAAIGVILIAVGAALWSLRVNFRWY